MQNEKTKQIKPNKSVWLLLVSLILMFFGIYLMFNPLTALVASAVIVGILFILMGCSYMMEYWQCRSFMCPALGILDILIGLILLWNLDITAIGLPILFGIWCVLAGITQFVGGLQLKRQISGDGKMAMLVGFFGMLFGLLIFLYPIFGVFTISILLGSYFILYGAFELNRYLKK